MTGNQINYWANVERARNNRAIEDENVRHNKAVENIQTMQARASITGANAQAMNAAENARHNLIMEQLNAVQVANQQKLTDAQVLNYESQSKSSLAGIAQGWKSLDIRESEVKSGNVLRESQAAEAQARTTNTTLNSLGTVGKGVKFVLDLLK